MFKLCEKCIYYLKNEYIKEHSLCLKYGKQKFYEFEKVIDTRNDPNKCGIDGKNFIQRIHKDPLTGINEVKR